MPAGPDVLVVTGNRCKSKTLVGGVVRGVTDRLGGRGEAKLQCSRADGQVGSLPLCTQKNLATRLG